MALFGRLKQILHPEDQIRENNNRAEPNAAGSRDEASVYGKPLSNLDNDKKKQVALLTPREHELYLLLLEGFTLKECAKKLSVKYSTANTHMTVIYRKLGVNSRAELIINYRGISD